MKKEISIGLYFLLLLGAYTLVLSEAAADIEIVEIISTDNTTIIDFKAKSSDPFMFVLRAVNEGCVDNITLDNYSLYDHYAPIKIMEGNVSGIQYGAGDELHELDMEFYSFLKEHFEAGTIVYILPVMEQEILQKKKHILLIEHEQEACIVPYLLTGGNLMEVN